MTLKTVCLQTLKTECGLSVYRAVNFMLKKIRKMFNNITSLKLISIFIIYTFEGVLLHIASNS
jgi:hypothetical protein